MMGTIIKFPPLIKQQVFSDERAAKQYAFDCMIQDVTATANIVAIDGQILVTVIPREVDIAIRVQNARKEWAKWLS